MAAIDHDRSRISSSPPDHGKALINPGMGWVVRHRGAELTRYGSRLAPGDIVPDFPGLQGGYFRVPWSLLEPEEGEFNWTLLDTSARRWLDAGREIAFRFTCSASNYTYGTPQWVREAGASGYEFEGDAVPDASDIGSGLDPEWFESMGVTGEGSTCWEPDFGDPIFLDKLDNFLEAAGRRYDDTDEVAFVDIGSFGLWGEGHTLMSSEQRYDPETIIKHIDLHCKHFPNTDLLLNDDIPKQREALHDHDYVAEERGEIWEEILTHAQDRGLGFRDDSILVRTGDKAYLSESMAQEFWPSNPVVLEHEHYGMAKDRGNWGTGEKLLEAVKAYHASYATVHWWPREFYAENTDLVDRINRHLGYRIQLAQAQWPEWITLSERLEVDLTWKNAGVAPCYTGGHPAITLKTQPGTNFGVFVDNDFTVADLDVEADGQAPTSTHTISSRLPPYLQPGTYAIYVSIGFPTGTPKLALPHPNADGARRYRIGQLTIRDTDESEEAT